MCSHRAGATVTLTAALVALCASVAGAQPGAAYLRVSFVDVGQGDAIWIQGPQQDDGKPGGTMVIDGGPDRKDKNRLTKYLRNPKYGNLPAGAAIDCMIATHPHDDHYPGLMDVLEQYQVRQIIDAGYPKDGPGFAAFRTAAMKERADGKKSRFVELRKEPGFQPHCGNLAARILQSYRADFQNMGGSSNSRENNASTVVQLTFGGFTFLFVGDVEAKARAATPDAPKFAEGLLLDAEQQHPGTLRANVLKVAHHGSETSSTLPFIRAVKPDIIVIMSGRKNFGNSGKAVFLPDTSVIARYQKENPKTVVLRTDEADETEGHDTTDDADGDDIYMYTDGSSLRAYEAVGPAIPNPARPRHWKLMKKLTAPSGEIP
jgi:competence protein ComEC